MNENQSIEWKESWRDENLKWICGFANANGGKLYIGVDDKGVVVGVDKIKKLSEDIPNKVRDALGIIVNVNVLEENGKGYIEIDVPKYANPISFKGQHFYRSGATNQELNGRALNEFLLKRSGRTWDMEVVSGARVEDLSVEAIERFKRENKKGSRGGEITNNDSIEILLSNLKLIDEENNQLNRAGVLLFHKDPERYIFGSYIKIGFFSGPYGQLSFHDEVHGPLMLQVERALELIKTKYIVYNVSFEGISRRENPTFPIEALRESLMNAVAHKDYSSNIPIQISVFHDHINFWNPGQLPQDWTPSRLFQIHQSVPFNPLIANGFFRSGDIESWGTGYRRIIDAINEAKLLPPIIDVLNGLHITYYSDVVAQLKSLKVEERFIPILEYVVKNGKISNSEAQSILGVSKTTAFRILQKMDEWIEQKGKVGRGTFYEPNWFTIGSSGRVLK